MCTCLASLCNCSVYIWRTAALLSRDIYSAVKNSLLLSQIPSYVNVQCKILCTYMNYGLLRNRLKRVRAESMNIIKILSISVTVNNWDQLCVGGDLFVSTSTTSCSLWQLLPELSLLHSLCKYVYLTSISVSVNICTLFGSFLQLTGKVYTGVGVTASSA